METVSEPRRQTYLDAEWVAPRLVKALIEQGCPGEVRALAEEGRWLYVHEWAKVLIGRGQQAEALALLIPFTEDGRWGPIKVVSDLLESWGRADEAIALCQPMVAAGDRTAIEHTARLLARHGREAEAFDLLRPHCDDWFHAQALVDISAGLDCDEEVAGLLRPHAEQLQKPGMWSSNSWNAVMLLATVLERQGHVDKAVMLLHTNVHEGTTNTNTIEHLADMLARHGRYAELTQLADGRGRQHAAVRLALHRERCGDIDGAVEVLRLLPDAAGYSADAHVGPLLIRAGRVDEGLDVLRRALPYGDDCTVQWWCFLMEEHGRAEETFGAIEELADPAGGMSWELFCRRVEMLAATGRIEQAIDELRARPEAATWPALDMLAGLLADVGQLDDAIAVLEPIVREGHSVPDMAILMIRRGQAQEAIELLRRPLKPVSDPWTATTTS